MYSVIRDLDKEGAEIGKGVPSDDPNFLFWIPSK